MICRDIDRNLCSNRRIKKAVLLSGIHLLKECIHYPCTQKRKIPKFHLQVCLRLKVNIFRPHPHVKHYHIKQNARGEFYLSEKHCCNSIPDLINYHKYNSGGLASRLRCSPCDRSVPATAGLSQGKLIKPKK